MSWESLGSSRNTWHESLEYLNYKLKPASEARMRAMRKQCGKGCPCENDESHHGCRVVIQENLERYGNGN